MSAKVGRNYGKELLDALKIDASSATEATIRLAPDEMITVTVKYVVTIEGIEGVQKAIKKYALHAIDITSKDDTDK